MRRRGIATTALVVAAGRGERLGRFGNKAFVALAGKPLVGYALEALRSCPEISDIVLVVAPPEVERARTSLLAIDGLRTERVVAGGADRIASVRAGLQELDASCDTVLIHDGARPFLTPDLIQRCLSAAREHAAVIAALPVTDTVKQVEGQNLVTGTFDRARLWLAQTPQVFRRALLAEAHERAAQEGGSATDDASLVERLGHAVHVVSGDPDNLKVTTPQDLARAESIVAHKEQGGGRKILVRSGIGYDAHRFAATRNLILGGVKFEGEPGLLGHSDADVLCHAICDALLGAAGAGDIGQQFPDTDSRYAGISSLSLLARAAALVRELGWEIGNVDTVVIAEAPRIAGRVPDMRRALAQAMGIGEPQVSVKGKTSEGLGFTGRREGIAAQAVCTLLPARGSGGG
jgi:2-C-methyl-D-erythritol 4-phosphate cytidylyltransferase/2-C-methyl-D-erythritol 2,4-cyclodiphosphate synthase